MQLVYAGIDIGGTNTVIGLFDETKHMMAMRKFTTLGEHWEYGGGPASYMDRLTAELRHTLVPLQAPDNGTLAAVGIGVPGQVDTDTGTVRDATNLGWQEVRLAAEMNRRLGVPVRIEHDVRAFAWGEWHAGAAQGCRSALCLTIGTGIAAGIVLEGRLVGGSHHLAGEIGHDSVDGLQTLCACGKIGCLETVVSASGIARLAEQAGLAEKSVRLSVSAADVSRMCADGDPRALHLYDYIAGLLAGKLGTAVALLDPEIVVVGGGVAEAGEFLLGPLRDKLNAQFPWHQGQLRVVKGKLGDAAVLTGALHLAYSESKSRI